MGSPSQFMSPTMAATCPVCSRKLCPAEWQDRRRGPVVILHGRAGADEYISDRYPSASNSHWIPWLQKQLLIKGHDVQTRGPTVDVTWLILRI